MEGKNSSSEVPSQLAQQQKCATKSSNTRSQEPENKKRGGEQPVITPPETLSKPSITTFPKKYVMVSVFYTPRFCSHDEPLYFLLPLFTSVQRHTLKSSSEDLESFPRSTLLTLFLPGHLACHLGPIEIIWS
jgi:hypothetical protein